MSEKTLQKKDWTQIILLLVMVAVLLAVHAGLQPDFGDDTVYRNILKNRTLWNLLIERYQTWSSRVIIEAVMIPFSTWDAWGWRIADSFMMIVLVWIVTDLFGMPVDVFTEISIDVSVSKRKSQILFFLMLCLVPVAVWSNAGWITTTINYLWAMTLGLVAMRPLKHWFMEEKCARWEYVVCPLCLLYAGNMEQMAAILFGVYAVCGGWILYRKKKAKPFYFVQVVLILVSLLFILTAPGNALRSEQETANYLPYFGALGFLEKVWMGFLETGHYYLAAGDQKENYVFGFWAVILLLAVADRIKGETTLQNKKEKVVAFLTAAVAPLFFWGIAMLGHQLLSTGKITHGRNGLGVLIQNRYLPEESYFPEILVYAQTLVYLVVFLSVIVTLVFLWKGTLELWLQLLILGAGFLSKLIMGFSPTVYASGDRTAIFCTIALLIVALRNLSGLQHKWAKCIAGVYALICIVLNFQGM